MVATGLLVSMSDFEISNLILESNKYSDGGESSHHLWDIEGKQSVFVGTKDECESFLILNGGRP
jgi:hypothetical protein